MVKVSEQVLARLVARLNELSEIAAIYYKRQFKTNTVCLDLVSDLSGLAYRNDALIRLNPVYLMENTEDFLHETVAHELGHRIAFELYGADIPEHGIEWKEVMAVLGAPARLASNYDDSTIRASLKAA